MTADLKLVTGNARLLLVDDDPDITYVIKRGLDKNGFAVEIFNDSRQALARFSPTKYDAALLDVRLPGISGLGLANELLKQQPELQICFMSAYELTADQAFSTAPGFANHCFITKPQTIYALATHLNTHFVRQ